ncbi:MAG TPA: hypothetical protein VNX68_05115, partial [Nitrosopumilaceae archaeon]|nr:hypothetical protein [Nitrosopumilaceae archaeon]
MNKTVYFVGMHHKPGMKALDSKTKSGKILDEIISSIKSNCVKTNLCETEYQPIDDEEIGKVAQEWYSKYEPKEKDVIVLLGMWVAENFDRRHENTIELTHPASFKVSGNKSGYISDAIEKINNLCLKP